MSWDQISLEAVNFSLTALGKLCCVTLSFCCVVLPCLVFLSISWMTKVMYMYAYQHVYMYMHVLPFSLSRHGGTVHELFRPRDPTISHKRLPQLILLSATDTYALSHVQCTLHTCMQACTADMGQLHMLSSMIVAGTNSISIQLNFIHSTC